MESAVMMLPSKAQSVSAESTAAPSFAFSVNRFVWEPPLPMAFLARRICFAFLVKAGIIRSTITRSRDRAGMIFPNRAVNLSLVSTRL